MKAFEELEDEAEDVEKSSVCESIKCATNIMMDSHTKMADKISSAIESGLPLLLANTAALERSQKDFAQTISNEISKTLMAVDSRQIVITENKQVIEWRFKILRDSRGDLDEVIATGYLNVN